MWVCDVCAVIVVWVYASVSVFSFFCVAGVFLSVFGNAVIIVACRSVCLQVPSFPIAYTIVIVVYNTTSSTATATGSGQLD